MERVERGKGCKGVELISTGIGMTKADMIPKFLVLFWFFFEWLIIVGVGKERVGEETRGGALPLVGAAEGLTLLGSQTLLWQPAGRGW